MSLVSSAWLRRVGGGGRGAGFDDVLIAGRLLVDNLAAELRLWNELPALPLELLFREALLPEFTEARAGEEMVCRLGVFSTAGEVGDSMLMALLVFPA